MLHFASYFLAQQLVCCVHVFGCKNPTPGRPQGSPLHTTPLPPLQRYVRTRHLLVVFVRAGVVWMSGWDPCGRPGVGRFPSRSTLTECLWGAIHRHLRMSEVFR